MQEREIVLQVEGVTKRFPGVLANDAVDLRLHRGEILALLGENGAGKSTLMNIIYGLYHPDEGAIYIKGKPARFASPREAIHSGIGMVHQHFQLIPVMSVAENVILGEESTVAGRVRAHAENSALAGNVRLIWGVLWRLILPVIAVLIGLLAGMVALLLMLNVATYLPAGEEFESRAYQRLDLWPKAELALRAIYEQDQIGPALMIWSPLVIAALAGAAAMVLTYRHARRTWRGRAARTEYTLRISVLDSIIDAVIDLFGTLGTVLERAHAANRVRELSRQFKLEVDPDVLIEKLPVGLQQRVEIVKALYRKADILILDEPTAVLTPQESQELFRIMRELAEQGVSIIFITHKLKEVFVVADTIVVMRNGKVVGTTTPAQATEESLAAMMVGREVILRVDKQRARPGDVVLAVNELSAIDDRGTMVVDRVSFEVRAGEVLGIAGVQGNGQTELVEVLAGLRKASSGWFEIDGQKCEGGDPREVTLLSAAHVPEDRQRYGLVKPFPVSDNLVLNQYFASPFATFPTLRQFPLAVAAYVALFGVFAFAILSLIWQPVYAEITRSLNLAELSPRQDPGPFIIALLISLGSALLGVVIVHNVATIGLSLLRRGLDRLASGPSTSSGGLTINNEAVNEHARVLVREFDIRTPSIGVNAGNLSGGNQQKLVVAREFSRRPRLLIAAQPTRGIDVGSIEFIHQRIINQRDEGAAVLLVSAELDEIMALSDRIAVIYKGRIVDVVPAGSVTREQLGLLMAGIRRDWEAPWKSVSEVTEAQV